MTHPAGANVIQPRLIRRARATVLLCVAALVGTGCPKETPPATGDLVVSFTGAAAANPSLLLFSGVQNATYESFAPTVQAAGSSVTLDAVSWDASRGAEFDVFTPERGAFGRRVENSSAADVKWLTDAIAKGTLDIAIPPLLSLPITVWMVATTPADQALASAMYQRQRLSADALLQQLGAGFALDFAEATLPSGSVPPDCNAASVIIGSGTHFANDRINVYYVKNYLDVPYASYAINCWMVGHPEIVFVSWDNSENPDVALAHEFGHALGLVHPRLKTTPSEIGGGHTDGVSAFSAHNLMESGGATVTNISVGQMYNMNFSSDSWFNRTPGFTRPVSRPCQDAWGAGECAALTLFVSGWPL